MPPRAYWTGNLKISLVTFGVRLYNVVSATERIRLNQIHRPCNSRIRQPPTCPIHGQVERSEIAKAYEFEKDKYVIIEQDEINSIRLRSEKTIEVTKFVKAGEVDEVYLDSAYYMAPDGPIADEPFRVVRAALESTGMCGIGRVTFSGREHPVLIHGQERGMVVNTLHTALEVRDAAPYFEEIADGKINKDNLDLAVSLIKGRAGKFDPKEFHDRYEDALIDLVKSKVAGQEPVIIQEDEAPPTFNFAEALRRSLGGDEAEVSRKKPAASRKTKEEKAAPAAKREVRKPPAASRAATPAAAANAGSKKRKRAS